MKKKLATTRFNDVITNSDDRHARFISHQMILTKWLIS